MNYQSLPAASKELTVRPSLPLACHVSVRADSGPCRQEPPPSTRRLPSAARLRTSGGRATVVGHGIGKCAPIMADVTVSEGCGVADVAATPSKR